MSNVRKVTATKNDYCQDVEEILQKLKASVDSEKSELTIKDLDFIYKWRSLFKLDAAIVLVRRKEFYGEEIDRYYFLLIDNEVCVYQIELNNVSLEFTTFADGRKGLVLKDSKSSECIDYINIFDNLYVANPVTTEPNFLNMKFRTVATQLDIVSNTFFDFKNRIGVVYSIDQKLYVFDTVIRDFIENYNQKSDNTKGLEFAALNALCKAHNMINMFSKLLEIYSTITSTIFPRKTVEFKFDKISILKLIYTEFNSTCQNDTIENKIEKVSRMFFNLDRSFIDTLDIKRVNSLVDIPVSERKSE